VYHTPFFAQRNDSAVLMTQGSIARPAAARGLRHSPSLTLWLMALASLAYALQQTLVVPALPLLGRDLHTSTTWVTWVFTGFLLSSAVLTPLVGKLGDTYGKKRLMVISLAGFAAGTVLCAVAPSISVLIAGRIVQGVGGAILPLAFGIVRDELPRDRVGVGLGLISAMLGVGAGFGLVASGLILEVTSWPMLFWIGTIPIVVALALVWPLVPESPVRTPSKLDWRGALSLSAGLVALLLALSQGQAWGWLSPLTLGVFAASLATLLLWVWIELRVPQPMVEIGMMRERTVFWTNIAAVLAGFALYGTYLLVPTFVQMPRGLPEALAARVDYGFDASVIAAGLFLLPASIVMLIVGPAGGLVERRLGARAVNLAGLIVLTLGAGVIALLHAERWEIVLAMALVGCGVGTVYAMLAKLIVDAVEPAVTGVAIGMNTVMRTIGGVIGGQIGAALLTSLTIEGTGGAVPSEGAFTATFWIAAGAGLLGAAGMLMVPRRTAPAYVEVEMEAPARPDPAAA
jgi:EmrB/QacA subfamily drug resistance transporter